MPTFKTEAIILFKRQLWEADRLYLLYTPGFGKLEAQVKSAVKVSSKLAGSLEPVSLVDLMVVRGRSRDTIAGVQLRKRYQFNNLDNFNQVNLIRELFLKMIKDGVREEKLYLNLKNYLDILESVENSLLARFLTQRFIWQMLSLLGYGPDQEQSGNQLFRACLASQPTSLQISDNLLQELEKLTKNYLRNILESDLHSFHLSYA